MRKAQKIWEIIKPRIEIEIKKGERFIVPKDEDIVIACPKFYYMSDEELELLIKGPINDEK